MANTFSIKNLQKVLPRLYSYIPFHLLAQYALPPLHVYFEVTYRCNLRCDMCHFLEIIEDTETNRKHKNEMSADQVKAVISKLPRYAVITFTGGEAFMKNDFMEIFEYAVSRHKVHIITNGTPLNETMVDILLRKRLRSLFGSGMFFLGVSMEGREELHDRITTIPGSFQKTTRGLERLLKERRGRRYPLVHLTCVINAANVLDLVFLYDYANDLGVNVCNFVLSNPATYWHGKKYDQADHLQNPTAPVEPIEPGILKEQLDLLEQKSQTHKTQLRYSPNYITAEEIVRYYSNQSSYKDYRCYVPWTKVGVSAYGDVFSCPHYRLGNVLDNGEDLGWNAPEHQEFRKRVKDRRIFPGCLGCCQSEFIGPNAGTERAPSATT
ncbi:MAG: radical SAM protein [Nitrospinota bacterium]|nr:radical SAM protein [Nitrospinota bacterium]